MTKKKVRSLHALAHQVSLKERRRFIRHPLCFPLKYHLLKHMGTASSKDGVSTTINVSIGGLLFAAKRPVPEGSMILIRMPFENRIFNIKAKVVHCDRNPEKKIYNIGVCFFRLHDAFKVKLIEQLYLISEFRDLKTIQLGKEVSLNEASREWIRRYSYRFSRLYW
ncbi:MAG: PilZ domain-containing protein [Candidatus Aureabacteria bacterium]|nr:PilZ domain-containing protein [Candidatus Auribacterota bacterium]